MNAYKIFIFVLVCLSFKNHFVKWDVHYPFLFILIISSCHLIISFAFSVFLRLRLLCLNLQILRLHLWSSNLIIAIDVLSFYYLPSLSTSINQKVYTIVPNLKQKFLSKLIFFYNFRSKKQLPCLQSSFLFHILLLKDYQFICFKKCTSNSI